jgi:Stress responsive A/B Barrel Domain
MIRHIVCWKLIEEDKSVHALKIKQDLEALQGEIPGLLHIEVGINAEDAPRDNWDVVLNSDFEDMAALEAYQVHPLHKAAAAFIGSVRLDRVCVDYEL